MTQNNSINETKTNKKENKTMKTIKKISWETVKTVVIAVLVTAIAFFILGMQYEKQQSEQVKREAAGIVKSVQVEVEQPVKQ